MERAKQKVCITGVTGYLGSWVLKKFVESGQFEVRGTVRDPGNEEKVKPIKEFLKDDFEKLELFQADLTDPESLDSAVKGCDFVVHTASPFPDQLPSNENDLIGPAVEGTLAIAKACHKYKIKRVVLTSSIAAIVDYNHFKDNYDENDWLDVNHKKSQPYPKSKALAEKSIWEYLDSLPEEERFELVVINPGFILGPILIKSKFTSQSVMTKLMTGGYPGLPYIFFPVVDVRDVADAHLKGLTTAHANERYIA